MRKAIIFSFLLLIYLYGTVGGEAPLKVARTPDWNNFETIRDIDPVTSREMLSKLSVQFYWDVLRGLYRTGVIAVDDSSILTEEMDNQLKLIKKVNKQINHRRQAFTVEHKIIETSILFMFMLSSIKDLSLSSDNMQNKLFDYLQTHPITTLIPSDNVNLSVIDLISQADVDAELEILQLQYQVMNDSETVLTQRQKVDLQNIHNLHSERKNQREYLHKQLLLAIHDHYRNIDGFIVEKHENLTQLFTQLENQEYELQQQLLQSEYDEAITQLQREITLVLELIQFRREEESRVFHELENIDLKLTQAKLDLSRVQMEQIVSTVFEEISSFFFSCFGDIWVVLLYTRLFLLFMITLITVIEVIKSLHLIVQKISSTSSLDKSRVFVSQQPEAKSRYFRQIKSQHKSPQETAEIMMTQSIQSQVVLNTPEIQLLQHIFSTFCLSFTTSTTACLPVVLLQGEAGCGKTFTSKLILEEVTKLTSNSPFVSLIMFTGHDLLALGTQANIFLRDLFDSKKKMVVVIDDVDSLIQSRDITSSSQSILYALLEGLRQPSCTQSVILTTRLSLDRIDTALLDRVDSILHFTLPSVKQRWLYLKTQLITTIGTFLTNQDDRRLLQQDANDAECLLEELSGGEGSVFVISQACGLILPSNYQHTITANNNSNRRESSSSRSRSRRREPQPPQQPEDERPSSSPAPPDHLQLQSHQPAWSGQQVAEFITKCRLDDQLLQSEGHQHVRVKACIQLLLLRSEGWSYRDLHKHVTNLRYTVQSSERCQLTTAMWVLEIAAEVANSNSMSNSSE